MSNTVDLDSLPADIRARIEELNRPEEPLFPIRPREWEFNFSTKETKELAEKVDLLIRAVNQLHERLNLKVEHPMIQVNPKK